MCIRLALVIAALLALTDTVRAQVRIGNDNGGRIGTYVDKYQGIKYSGENVIIDGKCLSACTIVLSVSPDRICVTPRASLGFHAAWDLGENGRPVTNGLATAYLRTFYPAQIRRWIDARGGLGRKMIYLQGRQLAAMYKPCATTATYANAAF